MDWFPAVLHERLNALASSIDGMPTVGRVLQAAREFVLALVGN
jgi:hypothetical protein